MNKFQYKFTNVFFPVSSSNIQLELNNFFNNFINNLNSKVKIAVITQLKSRDNSYITLGKRTMLDLTNLHDINNYIELLENKYRLLDNWYKSLEITEIIFNYTQISENDYNRNKSVILDPSEGLNLKEDQFKDVSKIYDLPLNNNYRSWGSDVQNIDSTTYKVLNIFNNQNLEVKTLNKFSKIINIFNKNFTNLIFSFQDIMLNESLNMFKRYVDKKIFYIINNVVTFYFNESIKIKNISKLSKLNVKVLNIITLDVETYLDKNDNMQVYCICTFDGKISNSYYLTDFIYINAMFSQLFNNLFSKYNSGKIIYIHNSSNFDLIFLLKYLVEIKNIIINPLIRDGKYINLEIKYGPNHEYNIQLRDSYLLLPAKLKDLTINFKTEQQKLEFDHNLINKSNLLNYKNDAIKYCFADCVALYQVLSKFNDQIFNLFKVNLSSSYTLPGLAFRIFRSLFMVSKIPIIDGHVFNDLSKAYYGGHVDMYIPRSFNTKIYKYDFNSLYPTAMKEFKFPTKLIGYFIGDISNKSNYKHLYENNLGIYKVEVIAPDIKHPLLPHKMDNTTVFGQGTWTGWYFSEELKNAEKYGYKFKILAGYVFESEYLFKDYIESMNKLKVN
jgi:hypothetical protein